MISGIDPKVDFAFKWLFAREQSIPLLISLINAVLQPASENEIVSLELLNPFNEQDSSDDKLSIVDVKARDRTGRQFDVEMQIVSERAFSNRLVYYWADLHQQQLAKGDPYTNLRPTISICLTNFVLFPDVCDYRLQFELCNREHNIVFSSDIMIVVLELPKFKLAPENLNDPLDRWLYFLRNAENLDSECLPPTLNQPDIQKALEELAMLSQDDLERERYKARLRVQRDEHSRLVSAREDGWEEGLEQGLEQGRKEMASIVLQLLVKRLGDFDEITKSRILALSLPRLKELGDKLLDLNSKEDIQNLMG